MPTVTLRGYPGACSTGVSDVYFVWMGWMALILAVTGQWDTFFSRLGGGAGMGFQQPPQYQQQQQQAQQHPPPAAR